MAYSSFTSEAEVGSWGTSSAVTLRLGFEESLDGKDLVKVHPLPNAGSSALALFLIGLCSARYQFPHPEKCLFTEFQVVTPY